MQEPWEKRGRIYFRDRAWKLALSDLAKALELAPKGAPVLGLQRDLATCHAELGELQAAATLFEKCSESSGLDFDSQNAAIAFLAAKNPAKFDAIRTRLYDGLAKKDLNTIEDYAAVLWLFALTDDGPAKRGKATIQYKRNFQPDESQDKKDRHLMEIFFVRLRDDVARGKKMKGANEAIDRVTGALKTAGAEWTGFFDATLAVAYFWSGKDVEASKAMRRSREWAEQRQKAGRPLPWRARFELQIMLDLARK